MMAGMTLVDFLLARIAEDEALARTASMGPHWSWTEDGAEMVSDHVTEYRNRECIIDTEGSNPPGSGPTGQHIARHDPARVLAECEAKRKVIDLHQAWPVLVETPPEHTSATDLDSVTVRVAQQMAWFTEREYRAKFGAEPPTAPVLKALGLPYASHPDYREEWRP